MTGNNELSREQIRDMAASLHDGGWRSGDREELIEEYSLDDETADRLCEALEERTADLFQPVTDAIETFAKLSKDAKYGIHDTECRPIIEEIESYHKGLLRYGSGASQEEKLAGAKLCIERADDVEAIDIKRIVREVTACIGQAIEILEANNEEETAEEVTVTKTLKLDSHYSLKILVTKEARALGLNAGDEVVVTIRRRD